MFTGNIIEVGKILQQERLIEAEQARLAASFRTHRPNSLLNRTAYRLGDMLIAAGEQLKRG
jgi:hypothetical protein